MNLWLGTQMAEVTAGRIFTVINYSWDFIESTFALPMALQGLARLQEITTRLNSNELISM
ncbi:hypothetical protein EOPP23_16810 [Endozoicomonas sp. OPT23]|uniref:hypothetical protein n=1 Tax=Endozoicomonas sp. OPT23 TaxID=2072845 RepID=UPI001890F94F|nr:hypothetical protein [Endozoicomonas sp. OPT23]MRI34646.1 hypothetical protein [Endozoicomonas sp. OPT23]